MAQVIDIIIPEPVTIRVGGRERHLCFDLNTFAKVEGQVGDIQKLFAGFDKGDMLAIRKLLWIGLVHEDPDLKEEEVGRWASLGTLKTLTEVLTDMFKASLPALMGEPDENPPKGPPTPAQTKLGGTGPGSTTVAQ